MAESPSGRESGGGGGAPEDQGPEDLRSDSKKKAAGEPGLESWEWGKSRLHRFGKDESSGGFLQRSSLRASMFI